MTLKLVKKPFMLSGHETAHEAYMGCRMGHFSFWLCLSLSDSL